MTRSRFSTMLLMVLAMLAPWMIATARAQVPATQTIPNHPLLTDKYSFEIGAYYARSSTSASLAPSGGGVGAVVDFEDTFGLDERKTIPSASFMWRITNTWRLDVDYFQLDRSATRTLANQVEWGDDVFPVGATVNASYDFKDIRVAAVYSFFKRQDKEVGIGLGAHVASIKASVESQGIGEQSSSVTAPLPVVTLFGAFALTNEWAVRVRADWLSMSYDIYSGDIRSTAIDVVYQPFRNFAFGLGIRNLVVDVDIDASDWHGKARTTFTGPAAFVRVSF